MKDISALQSDLKGNRGELSCKPTKSGGNSHHITFQLRLENSLIIANEHSLCCRAWLTVGGAPSQGESQLHLWQAQEERSIN